MSEDLVHYLPTIDPEAISRALMAGDLSKLSPEDRIQYYLALCQSAGLNPLTRPFIVLRAESGELVWYATRECAEQLRKRQRVSMRVLSRARTEDGLYIVTVEASTPDGRVEQAQGIVALAKAKGSWKTTQQGKRYFEEAKTPDGDPILVALYGTELANALQRAESKAKRRATLALCGLGLPDVDERREGVGPAPSGETGAFDPQTGALQLTPAGGDALQEDEAGETPPLDGAPGSAPDVIRGQAVGAERAREIVGEMFDRSEGRPEEGAP